MPKYKFVCSSCKEELMLYVPTSVNSITCNKCKVDMPRALPTLAGQEVRETVDQLTGQQWKQDQKAIIDNRKETHYWEVEVPRLVETYSLETCLQQGWLVYNDKDELVINKPPSKR